MDKRVTIAVVEDHPLAQAGMISICAENPGWEVVWSGSDLAELLALENVPDVIVLDLELNGHVVTIAEVKQLLSRGSRVLVVSALALPERVRNLLQIGVTGFASKHESTEVLLDGISAAAASEPWTSTELAAMVERDPIRPALSEQEQRALSLYASGLKLNSVARIMDVKPSTVKEYLERVRAKYVQVGREAPTKIHLARNAEEDGYI